jgi:uncharacterized protein (TIGR02099 family)
VRRIKTLLVVILIAWGVLAVVVRATTPLLAEYRTELERAASDRLGLPVRIGAVKARWYGLHPLVELDELVLGAQPRTLRIRRAQIDLAPGGLLGGSVPDALRITVEGMHLTAIRDADGRVSVTGGRPANGDQPLHLANLPAHLRLVDTRVVWIDHALRRPPLAIEHVDIQVDREDRNLRVRASLQTEAGEAALSARLSGSFEAGDWGGSSYLEVTRLDIARLLGGAPGSGLVLDGLRLDAHAWTQWAAARPVHSQGGFALQNTRPGTTADRVRKIAAAFTFARNHDGARLGLRDLDVELAAHRWPQGAIAIAIDGHDDGARRIDLAATYLRLEDLVPLFKALPEGMTGDLPELPAGLDPGGEIRDLRATVSTDGDAVAWRAAGRFDGLSVAAHGEIPGFDNLGGRFVGATDRVLVTLDSRDATVRFSDLFRNPLQLVRLQGQLELAHARGGWSLRSDRLQAVTPHLSTTSRVRLENSAGRPLFIDLQTDFRDGDAAHAGLYYPAAIMGEQLVRWLDRSIRSGRVVEGTALVHGAVDDFAFERSRSGVFQVLFSAEDITLDYQQGWPPLTGLDAKVKFHGNQLDISNGRGSIYDSRVDAVEARIASLDPASPVRIRGSVQGPLQNTLKVLGEPALRPGFGEFADLLRGEGNSSLALDITIPLGETGETALAGVLQFAGNALVLPGHDFALRDIVGRLDFDLNGLRAEGIRARTLGAPMRIDVGPLANGDTRVQASGTLGIEAIARQLDGLPLDAATGQADFSVDVTVPPRSAAATRASVLAVRSDLDGIAIALPAPFGKPAQAGRTLAVRVPLDDDEATGSLHYGEALSAVFSGDGGRVGLQLGGGAAQLPATAGVQLRGRLAQLDIGAWRQALPGLAVGNGDGLPVDARLGIDRLTFAGGGFSDLQVEVTGDGRAWQGQVTAAAVEGRFVAPRTTDRGIIDVQLARLFLPMPDDGTDGRPTDATAGPDPSTLPGLALVVDDFRLADADLGRLELLANPVVDGLELARLELGGGALQLGGRGAWRREPTGIRTRLDGTAQSADIGDLLADLGYTRQLEDAPAEARFALHWPGGPQQVQRATLAGELELAIGPGRLVEVDPGVTRVIGLINLNALTRRLRLDFSDIFGKGFSFDKIDGGFAFADGVATTADLRMTGPSGRLRIEGATDLVAETFDQDVIVIPKLDATLPIAGTIAGGPVAGLAVLVAQQAMSGQIDQIYRFDYAISGPWADPVIELKDSGGTLSRLLKPLRDIGAAVEALPPEPSAEPPATEPPPAPPASPAPQTAAEPEPAATPAQGDSGAVSTVVERARAQVDRTVRKLLDIIDNREPHGDELPGESR